MEALEEKKQAVITKMVQEKDEYNNPNWPYQQASYLAEIRAFEEISSFLQEK
jgi:hypothetical protein